MGFPSAAAAVFDRAMAALVVEACGDDADDAAVLVMVRVLQSTIGRDARHARLFREAILRLVLDGGDSVADRAVAEQLDDLRARADPSLDGGRGGEAGCCGTCKKTKQRMPRVQPSTASALAPAAPAAPVAASAGLPDRAATATDGVDVRGWRKHDTDPDDNDSTVSTLVNSFESHEDSLRRNHSQRQTKAQRKTELRLRARTKVKRSKALSKVPCFSNCSEEAITAILSATKFEKFAPGAELCRQGDPADKFHVITKGTCSVTVGTTKVGSLCELTFFGESSLQIDGVDRVRNATVAAEGPVQLLSLHRDALLRLVELGTVSRYVLYAVSGVRDRRMKENAALMSAGDRGDHGDGGAPVVAVAPAPDAPKKSAVLSEQILGKKEILKQSQEDRMTKFREMQESVRIRRGRSMATKLREREQQLGAII